MRGVHLEHDVADAVIAVGDRRLVLNRQVRLEPGDKPVHGFDLAGFRGHVLLRPALELARGVALGAAVIPEPQGAEIHVVQRRQGLGEGVIGGLALQVIEIGQVRLHEDAAGDEIHQVKGRADDGGIVAEQPHLHDGDGRALQRGLHPIFAVDGVGARQELARRLLAQHEFARRRGEQEGRVRLAALELPHRRLRAEVFEMLPQIVPELLFVETVARSHVDELNHGGSHPSPCPSPYGRGDVVARSSPYSGVPSPSGRGTG